MTVWEIVLLGAALAMDAVAVGMADGMSQPKMRFQNVAAIAGAFGLFQFFMPLVGYLAGGIFSAFVSEFAPRISFLILAFLGGKMILDGVKESSGEKSVCLRVREKRGGALKLFFQALATSIDALAVGVTLLALEESGTLALPAFFSALVIGGVTFVLSFIAVLIGKKAGAFLADKAGILGGTLLALIGLKILLESV